MCALYVKWESRETGRLTGVVGLSTLAIGIPLFLCNKKDMHPLVSELLKGMLMNIIMDKLLNTH